jgi:hypothetical protein
MNAISYFESGDRCLLPSFVNSGKDLQNISRHQNRISNIVFDTWFL